MDDKEREIFTKLKGIKVVFDIGARDTEYPDIKPDVEYHLFEPNKEFYNKLVEKYGDRKNIHINNFGLGDKEGMVKYNSNSQSFEGGECEPMGEYDKTYPIKKLDSYIRKHKIKRLDFLKVDTEGYDYIILKSSPLALSMVKYIQYETWNDPYKFANLLGERFTMENMGNRNILCKRKYGK